MTIGRFSQNSWIRLRITIELSKQNSGRTNWKSTATTPLRLKGMALGLTTHRFLKGRGFPSYHYVSFFSCIPYIQHEFRYARIEVCSHGSYFRLARKRWIGFSMVQRKMLRRKASRSSFYLLIYAYKKWIVDDQNPRTMAIPIEFYSSGRISLFLKKQLLMIKLFTVIICVFRLFLGRGFVMRNRLPA